MNASNAVFFGTLALLVGSGSLASSTSSVVTTVNSNSPSCVVEIPNSASISSWSNSTMQGSAVTFSNGTEIVFPADTCVRPVYSSIYALDLAIESNANFTRAENGPRFAPPTSYRTCSQFAAQRVGASSVVCPPQGTTFATSYPPFSCPGGATNVTANTDCAPYVMLSFGLFAKTLMTVCGNEVVTDQLRGLNVYVPGSNGTFDTSSVLAQNDTSLNFYECVTAITTLQGTSTNQSVPSIAGSSSVNTTSQGTATSQNVSSSKSVEGSQPSSFETIGIAATVVVVAVVVVTGATVMTKRHRD
jgi:hypothetical protein